MNHEHSGCPMRPPSIFSCGICASEGYYWPRMGRRFLQARRVGPFITAEDDFTNVLDLRMLSDGNHNTKSAAFPSHIGHGLWYGNRWWTLTVAHLRLDGSDLRAPPPSVTFDGQPTCEFCRIRAHYCVNFLPINQSRAKLAAPTRAVLFFGSLQRLLG
jgi:hypothetical protein